MMFRKVSRGRYYLYSLIARGATNVFIPKISAKYPDVVVPRRGIIAERVTLAVPATLIGKRVRIRLELVGRGSV